MFDIAKAPRVLEEIYRIRYQVYCKECSFIKPEDCPEGIEKDEYDQYSLHFVAQDPNEIIGTARLILDSPLGFPLEHHCNETLAVDKNSIPRKNTAEISRLVISKEYRRRRDDGLYYSSNYGNNPPPASATEDFIKRIKPMAFGIYREMYQESKRRGITHWYALMEKSLWLLLRIHSFNFRSIGEQIDLYGPVKPYLAVIEEMEKEVRKNNPQLFQYFLQGLEPEFQPRLLN